MDRAVDGAGDAIMETMAAVVGRAGSGAGPLSGSAPRSAAAAAAPQVAGSDSNADPSTAARGCTCGQGEVMHLLAGRVPLTLLMDLAMPAGPPSRDVLRSEGLPPEPWWERGGA